MKQARNYILFLIIALSFNFIQPAQAQVNASDFLALVAFYNSTNGSGWTNKTNWLTCSIKTWYGVSVSNGRVTNLSLSSNKKLLNNQAL